MRILVLYGTSEGQTRKVATFVADRIKRQGHEVALVDVLHQPPNLQLTGFDAAIIAARVHAGLYQRQIVQFARANSGPLAAIPNAFLSVSMSGANLRPGDLERAQSYVSAFIQRTGWTPRQVLNVAGARLYAQHGAVTRWILGLVDRHQLDTSKDHVCTDWTALERFAGSFLPTAVRTEQDLSASARQAGGRPNPGLRGSQAVSAVSQPGNQVKSAI